MKATIVRRAGKAPGYRDFEEPAVASGENRIGGTAFAIGRNARTQAEGTNRTVFTVRGAGA